MSINKKKISVLILASVCLSLYFANTYAKQAAFNLPQFTQQSSERWINSSPLRVEDLQGKVALVDIWAYGCWNCYRSIL